MKNCLNGDCVVKHLKISIDEIIILISAHYNIKDPKFMRKQIGGDDGGDREIYDMFDYVEGELK